MLTNKFKVNYSIGAIPNGIKTDTFTFFLLFFYSNIIGLNPGLAGLAIFIALCVDAITDPLMGTISDRTNSKYGRRHPYMMISFIPMSLGYILLFAPRQDWDMSQNDLFIWMTLFTVLTRIGMTLFDIPHRAFGGEVTKDYEERTLLMSWREMIAWVAGLSNAFLGYGVFFASTPEYPQGQLNPDAWFPFALTGAIIMIVTVLYSSFTTKDNNENLSKWTGTISLQEILKELKIAIGNKSFLIFFFGNLFLSLAWGLANTLTLFVNTYFWEFEATQIKYFLPIYLAATLLAFYITPRIIKVFEKRTIVLISIAGVGFLSPAAFVMFNLGLTPEKGSLELVFFISAFLVILITFNVIGIMVRDSMVGDIADEVELQSNKRQEGILFATVGFMQKLNAGLGSFFAGQVLAFINFDRLNHTAEQAYTLAFIQGPLTTLLMVVPFIIFFRYSLSAQRHKEIIKSLK
ncbi:MAG: MFS transporter [Gammaproteobacteria bacterium TMED226]|nr:MAG: MFS transporter [Gammaproteobacteria bacterium TMED226]|tara:strand:+ start:4627 stop:6012 length:1386 start_codon:yes stop_codon:yes gene_type:complete